MSKGCYGNMKRHIERRHRDIYLKEELRLNSDNQEIFILECIDEKAINEIDYITIPQNETSKEDGSHDDSCSDHNVSHGGGLKMRTAILVSKKARGSLRWVKKFMKRIGERETSCLICSAIIRMPRGSYNNMKRHIEYKHPDVYKRQIVLHENDNSDNETYRKEEEIASDDRIIENEKSDTGNEISDPSTKYILSGKSSTVRVSQRWVKKFMKRVGDRAAMCLICSTILSMAPGSYNNMKRHIQSKHPDEYKKHVVLPENDNSDNDTSKEEDLNVSDNTNENQNISHDPTNEEKTKIEKIDTVNENIDSEYEKLDTSNENMDSENEKSDTGDKTYKKHISSDKSSSDIRMRRRWVKDYCKRIDDVEYECNICSQVLRMRPGVYNNMKRHIISKHPDVYEKELAIGQIMVED